MKNGVLLSAVLLSGCATVHIETFIPAPPAEVWSELMNGPDYGEWHPVLRPIKGEFRQGETLIYEMTDAKGKKSEVKSRVNEVVDDQKLNQSGGLWGIMTFDHTWTLEAVEGGTRVTQHEEYGGIGVLFWDYSWVEPAYTRANEALKQRVSRQ